MQGDESKIDFDALQICLNSANKFFKSKNEYS